MHTSKLRWTSGGLLRTPDVFPKALECLQGFWKLHLSKWLSQIAGEITEASEQPCKLIAYFFTSLLIVEGSHHVLCVGGRSPQAKPDASKIIPQDRSLAKRPMRPAYLSNAATLGNVEEPPSCMAKTLIGEHGKPTVCDPLPKKAARSGMHSSWAAS